jgi:superfamily I DNA/RNA helicase
LPQFDQLRGLLFPEIRIASPVLPQVLVQEAPAEDHLLHVMDLQQEQLARSMGEGHRILRGVAGSGKTLIIAFRAEHIARNATRPVLLLCFGNGIAGRLENAMQDRGVIDKVQVSTFHSWCFHMARTYSIDLPSAAEMPDYGERLAVSVAAIAKAVEQGHIPSGQYEAVLIDEAHDFEADWLQLAARMVSPETNALMIAYDDMQAIYKGRTRPVWSKLGISAKGRTTVLKINYRNTAQILRFARRFASDVIGAPGTQADEEDAVLLPEDAGRDGVEPEVRRCVSVDNEAHAIAQWLLGRKAAGYDWAHMAVLYPEHWIGEKFAKILANQGVPVDVAKGQRNRVNAAADAVRLLSMHNAKGLEYPCVAIGGLGALGARRDVALEDDVRLAYVAVTRATHEAYLTYSKRSPLVERIVT